MSVEQTATDFGVPVISRPGERERVEYYASTFDVVLRAEETGGRFYVMDTELGPADAPPFHVHTREDEVWIVQTGRFRFWIGGDSLATAEVSDVGPGAVVYGPRNVPHTFQSIEGRGKITIMVSPGDGQGYWLDDVGPAEAREDFEHLDRLERIGVHVLDRAPVDGA